jgi:mono/diheme cytochrome c family protein
MKHRYALLIVGLALAPWLRAHAADTSASKVARGRTLATAGDCVACHTADKGKPFAGGRPIETPFGVIYSPNLTPDRDTGIGGWSDEQFYRAMHEGIGPSGRQLYPAFPYPYFTRGTHEDVSAIRAYLDTLEPVKSARQPPKFPWPLNWRFLLHGWNWLYFDEGTFQANAQKGPEWNRGAYLVEGLGHCGACHTAKNFAGGSKTSEALQGGALQGWFAPNLTNEQRIGLNAWSTDDIVDYLKTGRNSHSGATGLMAEVITDSTSKLDRSDLHAIASYLKDQPGQPQGAAPLQGSSALAAGRAIYQDSCSACHQSDGKGVPQLFSPLAGSALLQSRDHTTAIRLVLEGARTAPTDARPTTSAMPAYGWKLTDAEVAAVLTYAGNDWGNATPEVTEADVKAVRQRLQAERDH